MTTNLFGLAAGACIVVAVAGLAGPLWALLLLGLLLAGMTYVSHTQDDMAARVQAAVDKALSDRESETGKLIDDARAEERAKASHDLDEAIAAERAPAGPTGRSAAAGRAVLPLADLIDRRNGAG